MRAALTIHHGLRLVQDLCLPHHFYFFLDSLLSGYHFEIVLLLLCFRLFCCILLFQSPFNLVVDHFLDKVAVLTFRRSCWSLSESFLISPCRVCTNFLVACLRCLWILNLFNHALWSLRWKRLLRPLFLDLFKHLKVFGVDFHSCCWFSLVSLFQQLVLVANYCSFMFHNLRLNFLSWKTIIWSLFPCLWVV